MKTWQNLFDDERAAVNDRGRIVHCTLTKEALNTEFKSVQEADEQVEGELASAFAWSPTRVYLVCRTHRYELGITSILRHPPL